MQHYSIKQLQEASLDELLTRLEFAAKDMRNCEHPDQYEHANQLAWGILNALSNHRESPYGFDSKFRKGKYLYENGKTFLDLIRENKRK